MANVTITELPALSTLNNADVFPVVNVGANVTQKVTGSTLKTFLGVGNLAGNLTGNLVGNGFGAQDFNFVSATGNISGNFIIGDGSQLTNLPPGNYSNANVANYLPTYSGNLASLTGNVTTTANVSANFFLGNGSQLTGIVTNYSNANVFNYLGSNSNVVITTTGNVTGGNILSSEQVVARGTVSSVTDIVVGNIANTLATKTRITSFDTVSYIQTGNGTPGTTGNIVFSPYSNDNARVTINTAVGDITANGNISGNFIIGDGSQLTNLPPGNYSNANVANYLPTYAGNLSSLTGNVTTTANVQANYFIGDGSQLTNLPAGTQIVNGNSNVRIAAAGGNVTVAVGGIDNVVSLATDTVVASANIIPSANVTYDLGSNAARWKDIWLSNSTLYLGETAVSANANGLVVNNEIVVTADANNLLDVTSIVVSGNITANGNISGNFFIGDGSQLTNLPAGDYSNANVANYLPTYSGNLASLTGNVITTANVQANFFLGDGSQLTNLPVQPGTYSNANVANYLPTYSGNLESLTGNVTTTGNISGNFIIGDGSQLTNLPAGDYSNANVANYLPTYSGNLVSLTGNVTTTANIQANFFIGNGSQLTGLPASYSDANVTALLGNLNANTINSAANITTTGNIQGNFIIGDGSQLTNLPAGDYSNANVANYLPTYTGNLASLTGNVTTTANIQGNFILGNGAFLTGLPATYSNADVANYLPTYTGNLASLTGNVTTTANIQANYFIGNGSQLTGIISSYGDSNVAAYLPTYTGNLDSLTGNVTTTANVQANYFIGNGSQLTGVVGNYGDANVTTLLGNLDANVINSNANITTTGNIQGNFIIGDGSQLTNLPAGDYSNANVANYLPTYSGNLVSLTGNVTTTANIQANYFIGNGSQLTGIIANYSNANVANYLPTYTGNLDSLTGNIITTGNVTANFFIGNGSLLSNINAANIDGNYSNANVEAYLPTYTGNLVSLTGNVITTGNLSAGNIATRQVSANNGVTITGGILNMNNRAIANADQISISDPGRGEGLNFNGGNLWSIFESPDDFTNTGGNLQFTSGNTANVSNLAAYTRVTFNTLGQVVIPETDFAPLVVASNILVANLNASLLVGAVPNVEAVANTIALRDLNGNLTANFFIGNGSQLTGIVANYSNANVANYLPTYTGNLVSLTGDVVTTGNITGNVITGNTITTTGGNGNITGVNYITANYFVGDGSLLSNINAANVTGAYSNANVANYLPTYTGNLDSLTGNIITTGNITANFFIGNGSLLSNINAANIDGNYSNANVANYLPTYTGNLVSLTGNVTTTGNLSAGNISTALVTATNGMTITGGSLAMGGRSITNVNAITIADPGVSEGINWLSGSLWQIFESPDNFTNTGGNLQFTTGNTSNVANTAAYTRVTFNTLGQIAIPETDFAPLVVASNVLVANLNANLLQGFTVSTSATANTIALRDLNGNLTANFFIGDGSQLTNVTANANLTAYSGNIGGLANAFSVTIGSNARSNSTSANAVAIGTQSANTTQGANAISIGLQAALTAQGDSAIAIGVTAGGDTQAAQAIAIGAQAGGITQSANAVAIGTLAGYDLQAVRATAVGPESGYQNQGANAVAVGFGSGYSDQGNNAVAIGYGAAYLAQDPFAVAIGANSAFNNQGTFSICIGSESGNNQGNYAVALGGSTGDNQGEYSIAIGYNSGDSTDPQANNSIILNATGANLNSNVANTFVVKPVRNGGTGGSLPSGFVNMAYNPTTGEIIYWT